MHVPVMLREVLELLKPKAGEFMADGTLGGGGHTKVILQAVGIKGKVLALDWDKEAVEAFAEAAKKGKNLLVRQGNYADLLKILEEEGLGKLDGLLLDLGFSSDQVESSGRGFSFMKDEPLYMTYDEDQEPVASILSRLSEKELADIIYLFSGERMSRRIAKAIKERVGKKAITSSMELAQIVREALPKGYEKGRMDPARRTFQALRIYANEELENLETILKALPKVMASQGRVAIISFHSLEDRLVKNYFKKYEKEKLAEIITIKPITASSEEIKENPRSRSAKLRGIKFK